MASINREHLYSYADEEVMDLLPGKMMKLSLEMHEGEMKLLIPDPSVNTRMVRIAGMHPSSLTDPAQWDTYGLPARDIDFDSSARIFVAHQSTAISRFLDDIYNFVGPPLDAGTRQPSLS